MLVALYTDLLNLTFAINRICKLHSLFVTIIGRNSINYEAMTNLIPTLEEIKQMISQLPIQEQISLLEDLEEKLETAQMMQLAETGFSEWNDEEEDIYDV